MWNKPKQFLFSLLCRVENVVALDTQCLMIFDLWLLLSPCADLKRQNMFAMWVKGYKRSSELLLKMWKTRYSMCDCRHCSVDLQSVDKKLQHISKEEKKHCVLLLKKVNWIKCSRSSCNLSQKTWCVYDKCFSIL